MLLKQGRIEFPRCLAKRSLTTSIAYIFRTWLIIFAMWYLCIYHGNMYVYLCAYVVIGIMQYHLNILGHDGLHFLLSKSKKVNDCICHIFLHGPQGAPLSVLRKSHLQHHRLLATKEDPDAHYYLLDSYKSGFDFVKIIALSFFGGAVFSVLGKLFKSESRNKIKNSSESKNKLIIRDLFFIIVSQLWIFYILIYFSGSLLFYFLFWALPIATIMFGLNFTRSMLEHSDCSLDGNANRGHSFISNFFERFILSPFNMNFHAEHHLWPAIPFKNLPEARRKLLEESLFFESSILNSSYSAKVRSIFRYLRAR